MTSRFRPLTIILTAAALTSLTACAGLSNEARDTSIGAAVGGVAGSVITGTTAGAVGGAVIGGVIGNINGKKEDKAQGR